MSSFAVRALGAAISGAAAVAAHGHVQGINVAGVWYNGYDPTSYPYMSDPPTVVGWTADDTDNGYVSPDAYSSGDIICHVNATPAGGYATVQAGDHIELYWTAWPSSHHGPVLDYLAKCTNDDCTSQVKAELDFFKMDAVGLVSDTDIPGTWGTDNLISNNNSWVIQIPSELESGNYVLRHEIIALHSAESADGAQNYPQCFNLAITGTGSLSPTGTLGEKLYSSTEAGILVDIYETLTTYDIPGPTMIAAGTNLVQSELSITASSSAVTDVSAASTAAAATTTAASAPTSSGSAAGSAAAFATSSTAATTSVAATTSSVETTVAAVATASSVPVVAETTSAAAGKSCGGKKRHHARHLKH